MNVGLTGDIGSGKSTVLKLFEEAGFSALSADAIVHDLLREDHELIEEVCTAFGSHLRNEEGSIDRRRLGALIFEDQTLRKRLEGMVHPRVGEVWKSFLETHAGEDAIVEIPLLFEKKLETSFDHSVTVYTSFEIKLRRLLERGMDDVAIRARLDAQLHQESKADRSDFLITNNGSLEFLRKQVIECIQVMKQF